MSGMTTTDIGRAAEKVAAQYLQREGYRIIALNWRTPQCEIDIIAEKDRTIYFVECKYRSNDSYGTGFDYITKQKQRQMQYAARMWIQNQDWRGPALLAGIELSGKPPQVDLFLPLL